MMMHADDDHNDGGDYDGATMCDGGDGEWWLWWWRRWHLC